MISKSDGTAVWTGFVSEAIHNLVSIIKTSGLWSFDLAYMLCTHVFTSREVLYLYLFYSLLVIYYCNTQLTEVDVMHEAGHIILLCYVYSMWST